MFRYCATAYKIAHFRQKMGCKLLVALGDTNANVQTSDMDRGDENFRLGVSRDG